MIYVRFEYGAKEAEPVCLKDDWFQITYSEVRDPRDNCVAYREEGSGLWYLPEIDRYFSDMVFF